MTCEVLEGAPETGNMSFIGTLGANVKFETMKAKNPASSCLVARFLGLGHIREAPESLSGRYLHEGPQPEY